MSLENGSNLATPTSKEKQNNAALLFSMTLISFLMCITGISEPLK